MSSFTEKILTATLTMGQGPSGDAPGETLTLSGLRMTVDTVKPIGDAMGQLTMRVFGLSQDVMNRYTSIGTVNLAYKAGNRITVSAGDDGSTPSLIFSGMIMEAWADYAGAPDVAFNVVAFSGGEALLKTIPVSSFKGETDVAEVMRGLATQAGLQFEDGGVKVKRASPYYPGTVLQQIRACAQEADIWHSIELGKLVIWPKNAVRPGDIPLISPSTGMVGYPLLNSKGATIKTLFDPRIRIGGAVRVESSLPMATGEFPVFNFSHSLSSRMPNGPWFTTMECSIVPK